MVTETRRVFHRLESRTQAPSDARLQEETGELWGRPKRFSGIPSVEAYTGPLPPGKRGIEFCTDVPPEQGSPPGKARWMGPREGVKVKWLREDPDHRDAKDAMTA